MRSASGLPGGDIEPNRLAAPGEAAARERVGKISTRLDELGWSTVQLMIPRRDADEREAALAELEAAADRHGRGELLDEARDAVRDALFVGAERVVPTAAYATNPISTGRVEDRVAIFAAIEDAVAVAVTEDLLDAETAAILANPGRRILGLRPLATATCAALEPRRDDPGTQGVDGARMTDAEIDAQLAEARADLVRRRAAAFGILCLLALPAAWSLGVGIPGLLLFAAAIGVIVWMVA